MRKIEVPTDSVPEFELKDTVGDIQWRREERDARERGDAQKQREEGARREEEARMEETHSQEEGGAEIMPAIPGQRRQCFSCFSIQHL